MTAGQILKSIRISRGCSQQNVADALGCSRDMVTKIEADKRTLKAIDIENLKKLFYQDTEEIDALYLKQNLRRPEKIKVTPAEHRCPYQEGEAFLYGIVCEGERDCPVCGWNPEVLEQRRKILREKFA